ncbi:MAG: hypothetical protein QOD92_3748 [Acidimicrobiaceae bacterium]|jgi:hypothetical protein
MRSRVLAILVAVVVPLAALGAVIAQRGDSKHTPARLPILAGGAAGETAALGAPSADIALYPYGGVVYKAGANLPALDGSARAYRIDRPGTEFVRRLADAFGFTGIEPDANSTFINGDEQLSATPSGYWGYTRQSAGGGVSSSSGVAVACAPNADCPVPETTIPQHPADLPSQEDARASALALLERAGIDVAHASVTIDDFVTQWSVRVDPIVEGLPTEGFTSTVTIGERGVVDYANGVIGRPVAADEYPLLGTRAAIDNLNNGKGLIGPVPMMAYDTRTATAAQSASPDAQPTDPMPHPTFVPPCDESGAPTNSSLYCLPIDEPPVDTIAPPPPQEITLIGAEQVLLFAQSFTDDQGWLVPAYRFTMSDGTGPTALAIDESFLLPPPGVDTGAGSSGSVDKGSAGIEPQPAQDPTTAPSGPPNTIEPGK